MKIHHKSIIIPTTDLPKRRDPNSIDLIKRKKGAHIDRKKQMNKEKCRRKGNHNERDDHK